MTVLPWIITALALASLFIIKRIEGTIMSEVQDAVDALTAQVVHVRDEVTAAIADLEAQIAAGVAAPDLTALKAAVQSVDDIVADAPAPVEEDVPPAE